MPNASAAGFRVGFIAEVTPGTTPAAALTLMRTTGGNGKFSPSSAESSELQLQEISDLVRTAADANGTIDGELSYSTLDPFVEAILGGTWATNNVQVGTTKRTFTIEDQYTDAAIFVPWRYSLIEKLSLSFALGSIPTTKVEYVCGTVPTSATTVTAGTGAALAANSNAIMSPVTSVRAAQEGGSGSLLAGTPGLTAFNIEITRPVIKQPQLGSLSLASADPSQIMVKGSFSCYWASKSIYDKLLADTLTSLSFEVGGASSLKYLFLMSKVRLADGGPVSPTRNQPVLQTYNFQSVFDTSNSSLKVTRTP